VIQIQQHLQGLLDDGVGLFALDINDETYAAGFVFKLRIIKPLLWRWHGSHLPATTCLLLCSIVHFRAVIASNPVTFYPNFTISQ
jgi:hypothetical protein